MREGSILFNSARLHPGPLFRAHGHGVGTFSYLGAEQRLLCAAFICTAVIVAKA